MTTLRQPRKPAKTPGQLELRMMQDVNRSSSHSAPVKSCSNEQLKGAALSRIVASESDELIYEAIAKDYFD